MKRFLCVALLLAPGLLWAEEDPLTPPDLSQYLRWGPLRVRPGFSVSDFGYDDNVFYATRGERSEGDYRITLSPKAQGLLLLGSRAFLTFEERLDFTLFSEFHDQNYVDQLGKARLTVPFGRFGAIVDLNANRRNERPSSEFDDRLEQDENRIAVGLVARVGARSWAELTRIRSDWSYEDPDNPTVSERLDRRQDGVRLELRYRIRGRTELTLETSNQDVTFDNPSVGRDSEDREWLLGVKLGAPGRLTGQLRVGNRRVDLEDPTKIDFSGAVGDLELSYLAGGSTRLRLSGRRSLGFAVFRSNNFFENRQLTATVSRFFNRVFGADVRGSRGRLDFPDPDPANQRVDESTWYEVAARMRLSENTIGRRVEYRLAVRNYRLDSNFDQFDQSRTLVSLGATFGF